MNNNSRLDVIYHTDLEVPEIVSTGCMRWNVSSLDDVLIDDEVGLVTLIQRSRYLNALGQVKEEKKEIIYMLGYIVPATEVLDDSENYRLFFPERFVEDSENGLAAIYASPSGKTRVLDLTENVRVFASTEELKEAVLEFTQKYLEVVKGEKVNSNESPKIKMKK